MLEGKEHAMSLDDLKDTYSNSIAFKAVGRGLKSRRSLQKLGTVAQSLEQCKMYLDLFSAQQGVVTCYLNATTNQDYSKIY